MCAVQTEFLRGRSLGAQPPVLMNERQEARDRQAAGARLHNKRTRIRAAEAGRQKIYDAAWLSRMSVGQGLTEEIMEPHAPVGRRSPGDACNQKSKGHRADSRFGSQRADLPHSVPSRSQMTWARASSPPPPRTGPWRLQRRGQWTAASGTGADEDRPCGPSTIGHARGPWPAASPGVLPEAGQTDQQTGPSRRSAMTPSQTGNAARWTEQIAALDVGGGVLGPG